ncbi:hypothetical protein ABW636_10515 [Aquimarina sp. 2201CG1-2-11]|uniref:hypothetical protein n=1 Tax=Aquimarina discodermiae TaxID=3231043 RepID=UPI003463787D
MRNLLIVFIFIISGPILSQNISQKSQLKKDYEYFLDFFIFSDQSTHQKALKYIETNWSEGFEIYTIESMFFFKNLYLRVKLLDILKKTPTKTTVLITIYGMNIYE